MELGAMLIFAVVSSIFSALISTAQSQSEYSRQRKMQEDAQDFAAEREDIAWERQRPQQYMEDLTSLGINPNLAASAILGGNAESSPLNGGITAPSPNSAIPALSSAFSGLAPTALDAILKDAQVGNLRADTDKKQVESGLLPKQYELDKMTTIQQVELWKETAKKVAAEAGLNSEQTKLVEQQRLNFQRLTDAQIEQMQANTKKAIAEAKEAYAKIENLSHQNANLDADTLLKNANTQKAQMETQQVMSETQGQDIKNMREQIALNFEKTLNAPLDADMMQYVEQKLAAGDFKAVEDVLSATLNTSASQELGKYVGTPSTRELSIGLGKNRTTIKKFDFNGQRGYGKDGVWFNGFSK